MVLSRGFSIVFSILTGAVFILLIGFTYLYLNPKPIVFVADTEEELLKRDVEKIQSLIENDGIKTASDFLYQTLDGELFSSDTDAIGIKSGVGTKVIGIIKPTKDPSCPNCFQISSGGDTLNIIYNPVDSETTDVQSGDVVIVNISGLDEDDEGEADDNQFVVDDIEEVDIQSDDSDEEEVSNIGDDDPNNGTQPTDPNGSGNEYDIDNSSLNIQILSDF